MEFIGNTNEYLRLGQITSGNCSIVKEKIERNLTLLWIYWRSKFWLSGFDGIGYSDLVATASGVVFGKKLRI